jgi:hypothetical protein
VLSDKSDQPLGRSSIESQISINKLIPLSSQLLLDRLVQQARSQLRLEFLMGLRVSDPSGVVPHVGAGRPVEIENQDGDPQGVAQENGR